MILVAILGWQNGLGRLDQSRYDLFLSTNNQAVHDDIIIIAIDDYSLSQLGRWPWPRKLHADLINELNKAKPRAIGLDVILSEAERPQAGSSGDDALATAIRENGHTVLPITMTNLGFGLTANPPVPKLAQAAQGLGHINLEHDSDGVVRSTFLYEGQGDKWWPHFSVALLQAGKAARQVVEPSRSNRPSSIATNKQWQRTSQLHIPFSGGIGDFKTISYVSVLRGEVPSAFFTDKYVLIGATALGMADAYPTAISSSSGAMPGIEINAQILSSLLDGKSIYISPPWLTAILTVIPVLFAMLGYLLLSPRAGLLAMIAWALLVITGSYFALHHGVWIAPSAALIMLVISYPLWSWRRLEAAITYLGQEFIRLDKEPHLLPEEPQTKDSSEIADVLEQRISAMQNAAHRVRDLRQFVSDNLDNLPDATLLANTDGCILFANKQAHTYYRSLGVTDIHGLSVLDLLNHLSVDKAQPIDQAVNLSFTWPDLMNMARMRNLHAGVSVQDQHGRDLLVKSAACLSASTRLTGWIISILNISTLRAAERSRDETLRFLSHDMRAPQASILALLELQSEASSALPQQEFFTRIEKASRKTLGLADNFVQLARAESHEYRLEETDFQDLLFDASDEMWSLAKNKNITLSVDIAEDEYHVTVDRTLMTRALANLISNAINYSPEGRSILCSLHLQAPLQNNLPRDPALTQIVCSIRDHGYGIADADQAKLFQRFQRVDVPNQARHDGVGLGLVFVKTVIERHQGNISFSSKLGEGTIFTVTLPCSSPSSQAAS